MCNEGLLTIRATVIGELRLDGFCPRCFWFKEKFFNNQMPFYTPTPGIVNSLDSIIKNLWRKALTNSLKQSIKFPISGATNQATYIVLGFHFPNNRKPYGAEINGKYCLKGVPDLIIYTRNNSLIIIDFKSVALVNEAQERQISRYEAQLNAYKYLIERNTDKRVEALYLAYLYPHKGNSQASISISSQTANIDFNIEFRKVEMWKDPKEVEDLVVQAGKLLSLDTPPVPREGCTECEKFTNWLNDLVAKSYNIGVK